MSKHQLAIDNSQVPEGYKKTEVGVIPEDWEVKKLAKIITAGPKNGYSGRSGGDARGTLTLRLTATSSGYLIINDETVKQLDEIIDSNSELFLQTGDVLIQRSNTYELVGTTAIFDGPPKTYIYPDLMMRLRFSDQSTAHWFWKYANSASGRRFFLSVAAGSTGSMPKISGAKLRGMKIPLPPKDERSAIAQTLSDVDGLIAALDKAIAKKRNIKTATMQELLTGKKRLPGFGEEWQVKRLGDIANITMGQSPSSQYYNSKEIGLPLIQGNADVKNRIAVIRNYTSEVTKKCYSGDIILSVRAPVGEVAKTNFDACIGRGVSAISYPNDFLYHYLVFIEGRWSKLSKGSTFDSINSTEINFLEIKLPVDLQKQCAIAQTLSDMDAEIAALEKRRAKTKAMKQGMMQELLTGKTRLIDPNNP